VRYAWMKNIRFSLIETGIEPVLAVAEATA
jgi:hypothetical protein